MIGHPEAATNILALTHKVYFR